MGPPGWARGSSLMTPSSVPEELMGRTPARETVAALWSVPASTTPTPTSRPASWPGALAVARTTPLESTPLFLRQSASFSSYWGYSAQQCQTWMDNERSRLSQDVAAMQNAGSLTGRKKAAALAAGVKAQKALNQYNQCNVFWAPVDAEPLTAGGDGYVDGGNVDVSNFERDTYPSEPLTDGTYSEPKTVDSAPLTDDSYSEA